jgi:hypothetical protein
MVSTYQARFVKLGSAVSELLWFGVVVLPLSCRKSSFSVVDHRAGLLTSLRILFPYLPRIFPFFASTSILIRSPNIPLQPFEKLYVSPLGMGKRRGGKVEYHWSCLFERVLLYRFALDLCLWTTPSAFSEF